MHSDSSDFDRQKNEQTLTGFENPVRGDYNFVAHVADLSTTIDLLFGDVDHRKFSIVFG